MCVMDVSLKLMILYCHVVQTKLLISLCICCVHFRFDYDFEFEFFLFFFFRSQFLLSVCLVLRMYSWFHCLWSASFSRNKIFNEVDFLFV